MVKKRIDKPLSSLYPQELETIGDHLKKARLDRKMLQKELGAVLGVTACTIKNWEKGHKTPSHNYLPKICDFLSYCPLAEQQPVHFGHKLNLFRRYRLGLSLEQCASIIGVYSATLAEIEDKNVIRFKRVEKTICTFINLYSWENKEKKLKPNRLPRSEWP